MEFFATSKGLPVHIFDSHKGEKAIIFLHGYLETLYIWNEFFELLPSKYRLIAIDLPGHGLSCSFPECNTMSLCAQVVTGVLDICNISQAVVVGHSMGGYIGQECLKLFPDRYSALVHFNSNPYADNPDKIKDREKEIDFINNGRLSTLASLAIDNMYAKDNLRKMCDKIDETLEICESHDPLGIAACIRGLMKRDNNVSFLSSCSKPILFIFGDHDQYLPPQMSSHILSDVPSAKGVIIPNTGHNSFLEEPKLVLDSFLDFLTGL